MGKSNNGLVYHRPINATVFYLLTTVLYFNTAYLIFLWQRQLPYDAKINFNIKLCTLTLILTLVHV